MRRFLIHYVIIVNNQEKKVSSVFMDYELPETHERYLDVEKFCENEKEIFIKDHQHDTHFSHVPQVHMISISEVPKLS